MFGTTDHILCIYLSKLLQIGFIAISIVEIQLEFLEGNYILTNSMLTTRHQINLPNMPLIEKQLKVLSSLKRIMIECVNSKLCTYKDVVDFCSLLKIPLYHVIIYDFKNDNTQYLLKNIIPKIIPKENIIKKIDVGKFEKNNLKTLVSLIDADYTNCHTISFQIDRNDIGKPLYSKRFNFFIMGLTEADHFFENFLILNETIHMFFSKASLPVFEFVYIHTNVVDSLVKIFEILKKEFNLQLKGELVVQRISTLWYKISFNNVQDKYKQNNVGLN